MSKIHDVTEKTRAEVSALKSFGVIHEDIAEYIGISVDTLVKKYPSELKRAQIKTNAEVASKLYKKAVKDEDLTAIIFWLKTRGRWSTESTKNLIDSNDDLKLELKQLRENLDRKNRKDY